MKTENVVTRFAPSPTGNMHVGGLRTALFAYLYAKSKGGTFILRIEDTDKEREVPGSIEQIMKSLRFVLSGDATLTQTDPWDFGPNKPGDFGSCVQSERLAIYNAYAEALVAAGYAYNDPYTKEELEHFRNKAQAEKRPFLFRDHRPEIISPIWNKNLPLRFKVTEVEKKEWFDEVRGNLSAGVEALDDFILVKSDGYPTYNFCHIIDDIEMGVTHVMRGEEFVASTPKFIALYEALQVIFPEKNITIPRFATLPPILGSEGTKKLSKRDGARDALEYFQDGYLPEAIANYLALQGWNPGTEQEIFSYQELVSAFSLEKIQKSGARWNEDKLLWVNKEHIKNLSFQDKYTAVQNALAGSMHTFTEYSEKRLALSVDSICERISYFGEIQAFLSEGEFTYLFSLPTGYSGELLLWKKEPSKEKTKERLQLLHSIFLDCDGESLENADSVKKILTNITEEEGKGEILWPLRTALSGKEKSIDPFTLVSILGKESVLSRITTAINTL